MSSPTVVVTPPGTSTLKDKSTNAHPYSYPHPRHHSHPNSHPLSNPRHGHSLSNDLAVSHEEPETLPADYLAYILKYQLIFRLVSGLIYVAGVFGWYKYRRMACLLACWIYWIPFHYAAMNALREEKGRHLTGFLLALASHALEAYVLMTVVYNPEVWGSSKLKYFVLPTATQGIANTLMMIGACGSLLLRRARGETQIPLDAIVAPALHAADIAFVISLLMIPYVSYTNDVETHRVVAATVILNVVALPVRHLSFTRSFTGIPHLPEHKLFAAITLSEAPTKGKELSRKMQVPIPGLPEDESYKHMMESDDMGFIQRVYVLHFARLATTVLAWDLTLGYTNITATVGSHPWIAILCMAALYQSPVFLTRLRRKGLNVVAPAVIAVDVLRGITLASAGGLLRWIMNVFNVGVSASEKEHIESHAHLIVMLAMMALLGARAALTLTFFTSSPRDRSARGAVVALVLAGSAITYMTKRLNITFSLSGLLPYSYTHDAPTTSSSAALFALLFLGLLAGTYLCAKEVWRANLETGVVSRLPSDELLLGTMVLEGGERKYERMRRRSGNLPQLSVAAPEKNHFHPV